MVREVKGKGSVVVQTRDVGDSPYDVSPFGGCVFSSTPEAMHQAELFVIHKARTYALFGHPI